MLVLELLLLLHGVGVVFDEATGRGDFKLGDSSIVEFVNSFVECISVDAVPLIFQLRVQLSELVLNRLRLHLELFVVETVFGVPVDVQFLLSFVEWGLLLPLSLRVSDARLFIRGCGRGKVAS